MYFHFSFSFIIVFMISIVSAIVRIMNIVFIQVGRFTMNLIGIDSMFSAILRMLIIVVFVVVIQSVIFSSLRMFCLGFLVCLVV